MAQVVLQTTQQSLAHRLWRYSQGSASWAAFYPEGHATEAEEVGPCTERAGPCLVHLRGSQLSAAQWADWVTAGPASTTVVRLYWLGASPGEAGSPEELLQQLVTAGPPPDGGAVRLQASPRSLEAWLVDRLPPEWNLQPVAPRWVLHVVTLGQAPVAGQHVHGSNAFTEAALQQQQAERAQRPRLLYSLQPAEGLYSYAAVRGKRVEGQLSKAAGKLSEALVAAGVQLTRGVAVDLGAAPGGWTHVLAQRARRVVAVDPAPLDPCLLPLPNVTHLACKAEDAVARIHELAGEQGIDLLVSDVNKHPAQLIAMLQPLVPLLRPGAALVFTLKFFGRSTDKAEEWRERLAAELRPLGFDRLELAWLLANTQHEQTAIAWKASS